MLDTKKLRIDPSSLGTVFMLTDVTPWYEYSNGRRTDSQIGFKYVVAVANHGLEKVAVKIKGKHALVETGDDFPQVKFENLELVPYVINGQLQISASATSIAYKKGN